MRLLICLLWLGTLPAWGHAVLLEAGPADGATLAKAPAQLWLRFNEPVVVVTLALFDAQGSEHPLTEVHGGERVGARPVPPLADGRYRLAYCVASADAHPVAGSVAFGVGVAGVGPLPAAPTEGFDWRGPSLLLRYLQTAAVLLGAGACLFLAGVPAGTPATAAALRLARLAHALWWPAMLAALGVRGALLSAATPAALWTAAPWRVGAGSTLLDQALLAGPAFALAVACAARRRRVAGACAALALLAAGLTGHAAGAGPSGLTRPLLAAHALAAGFWIGALLPLRAGLGADAVAMLRRFSALAVPAVAVLLASGGVLAAVQLRTPAAFVDTPYGRVLLAKLVLVAGLLALAVRNRQVLTPALAAGTRGAAAVLARSIGAECALAAGIVLAAVALGHLSPPRSQAPAAPAQVLSVDGHRVELRCTPCRAGAVNRLELQAARADGSTPPELLLQLDGPAGGFVGLRYRLVAERGRFVLADLDLPASGAWRLRVRLPVSDFERRVFDFEFAVAPAAAD
ncbi:copper transport protein [Plasticicumulans lactativorans]|uniref:Copper resistance protein C n=1 Tax=Plasticicumulans lactativorans TaxID=1133106 RepID=A0A4R2L9V7_9GAMM|nr:CopD family protein [Plasticicumulans lactativorans]TCO79558.1 copper transport protein [Plasticicumulans lactativorans]